jgi:polysaccharide biosynthesis/export protein
VTRRFERSPFAFLALLAVAPYGLGAGCAAPDKFVWVESLPPAPDPVDTTGGPDGGAAGYRIDCGDLLDIRVFGEERVSGRARVRMDGGITLALVGDVAARGKTPYELSRELEHRLLTFMTSPSVTIGIEETHPALVTVLGEVAHPGVYPLALSSGVLQALASAGGLTENADDDQIYVVRKTLPTRVRFTYRALKDNEPSAVRFTLQTGDVVTVE